MHENKLPLLAECASRWLCIPALSSPLQRVFSAGGNIVSFKRTKLQENIIGRILKTVQFLKISADKLKNRISQNALSGKILARFYLVLI